MNLQFTVIKNKYLDAQKVQEIGEGTEFKKSVDTLAMQRKV